MSDDGGMSIDLAEIVPLFPDADDAPVVTGPRPQKWCLHRRTQLDGEARRVYCRECGREVPAFDVLADLARDHERWTSARDEAKRQAQRAQEHLEELLRLERNAKARQRRRERNG